jgi:hypothetical protein
VERIVDATHVSRMAVSSGEVAWIEQGAPEHSLRIAPLSVRGPVRTLRMQGPPDRMGNIAFAPDGASVLLVHETGITRVPTDGAAAERVHTAPLEMNLEIPLRVEGTRVWFSEVCEPAMPDGGPLVLPRELDLATGVARWLSDDPRYPYVPNFPRMIVQTIRGLNSSDQLWAAAPGFYSMPPSR